MVTEEPVELGSRDAHAPVKISVVDVPRNLFSCVYAVMKKDNRTGQYISVEIVTASMAIAQKESVLLNRAKIYSSVAYEAIEVPYLHAG